MSGTLHLVQKPGPQRKPQVPDTFFVQSAKLSDNGCQMPWPSSARQLHIPLADRRRDARGIERLTILAAFDCFPGVLTICGGRLRGRLGRLVVLLPLLKMTNDE